jgi:outer membrane lipoprotein-sorting protein
MKPYRIKSLFSAHATSSSGALFGFCLGLQGLAVQAQTPTGPELVQAMSNAERRVEFTATQTITRAGAQPMTMRLWRSGFRRRVEWQSPPVMRGDVLVDNGADVWRYLRSENSAIGTRSTVGDVDLAQLRRLESKVQGAGESAGRPAWIVNIMRRGQNKIARRLWIDRATKIRLRSEIYDANGNRVQTSVLSNLDFGPVSVAQFRWSPPAGAKITRTRGTLWTYLAPAQRAAPWLQAPAQSTLPRGYVLESVIVDNSSGQGEAWLRYTNGLNRFSIFQQRDKDAFVKEMQQIDDAWFWTRDGIRFLVAGLNETDVKKLASSLK